MNKTENKALYSEMKTPIRYTSYKTKLIINDSIASLESTKDQRLFSYFLRIITLLFWAFVIYNLYHFNFLLFDELPLLISIFTTLLIYLVGFLLTFSNRIMKDDLKTKEYIDKNTGKINLFRNDDNYQCEDVEAIQFLCYSELRASGSHIKQNVQLHEINLIMKNNKRLAVCTMTRRLKKAKSFAERLSVFLGKPLLIMHEMV